MGCSSGDGAIRVDRTMDPSFLDQLQPRLIALCELGDALGYQQVLSEWFAGRVVERREYGFIDHRLASVRELLRLPAIEGLKTVSDVVTRRGVELHGLRARHWDTLLVATGLVVALGDEVRELHFPRTKELFQFPLKVSAALTQCRVQDSSLALVEVEPVANLLSHEPLNLVFQFNSHLAVVLGGQLQVQSLSHLNVLHVVVQHGLRELLPLVTGLVGVTRSFLEGVCVLPLHETKAITVGFQRVRPEQATGQLLLLQQTHVDVLDIRVGQAPQHQGVQHLGRLDTEPRVQLVQHGDVVGNPVVENQEVSTLEEAHTLFDGGAMEGMDGSGINVFGSNTVNDSDVIKEPVGFNVSNKSQSISP